MSDDKNLPKIIITMIKYNKVTWKNIIEKQNVANKSAANAPRSAPGWPNLNGMRQLYSPQKPWGKQWAKKKSKISWQSHGTAKYVNLRCHCQLLKPVRGPTHKVFDEHAHVASTKSNSRGLTGFPNNVGQKPSNYSTSYHRLSPQWRPNWWFRHPKLWLDKRWLHAVQKNGEKKHKDDGQGAKYRRGKGEPIAGRWTPTAQSQLPNSRHQQCS